MYNKLISQLLSLVVIFSITSCTSCVEDNTLIENQEVNPEPEILTEGDEVQFFLTPNPMEVPTILQRSGFDYNQEIVSKSYLNINVTTNYQKALALGSIIVDIGYCGINNDRKLAKSKIFEANKLATELDIATDFNETFITRFERNYDNVDSVSFLVLDAYQNYVDYLKNTDKEMLNLSILTGIAIESASILSSQLTATNSKEYFALFNRQQDYLKSLELIMQRHAENRNILNNLKLIAKAKASFDIFLNWTKLNNDSTLTFEDQKAELQSSLALLKEFSI